MVVSSYATSVFAYQPGKPFRQLPGSRRLEPRRTLRLAKERLVDIKVRTFRTVLCRGGTVTDSVSQKANQTTVKREFDDVELGEDKNDL